MQRKRVKNIRRRGYANIMFVLINLPMWRAQRLYDLLRKDSRFNLDVVVKGVSPYTDVENQANIKALKTFFGERGVSVSVLDETDPKTLFNKINPDVVFYAQPPDTGSLSSGYEYVKDRLHAYIPYGFYTLNKTWSYNLPYHNIAWRFYLPTVIHEKIAKRLSDCKGSNIRVVGEPHADDFLDGEVKHVWKDNGKQKRIIWAPHFQINPNGMFNRPSFLWVCDAMVEIAKRYQDKAYFVFKPHPRLFSELCNHPDWGEAKAKEYYNLWNTMPNSQVETGEFINLFKESDALIHDCGSFVAEYMFVRKPCMFLTHDDELAEQDLCDFGKKCFQLHYKGHNKEDIVSFLEDIVLCENDKMHTDREAFFNEYLTPPNGKSTAQNIYEDMCKSLFGDK